MASARGIEAGKAFVRTDADLSPLEKKLKTIGAKFNALGGRISGIGKGLGAFGAGAGALGSSILGPISAAVAKFTSAGDALDKMSARTGVSAEALAELGFAAEQGGSDIDTVEKGFFGLSRSLFDASRGSGEAVAALKEIGLTYRDLAGLSPEDQFQRVADSLANIQDESKRGAVAQKLFGRAGRQLLPMLGNLREIRQEARDLGLVLGKQDTDNAAKLADAFNRIKRTVGGAFLQIGAAVAVPLLKALEVVTSITASVNRWIANNRALVQQVAAIGIGLVAVGGIALTLGAAFIGVGASIGLIGSALGSIMAVASTVFAGIGAAVGAVLSPLGLLTAAVVGLGGYVAYVALASTGGLSKLSEMFGSLGETAATAWGGIVSAVGSGDLQAAGEIAFTALEVGWLTLTTKLREVWSGVADFLRNVWLNAVESIVQIGANIYFGVSKYFDRLAVTLQGAFDVAFTYISGAIDGIQTAIAKAIIKAGEFFGMFSKDQSVQIQQSLDEDLARRSGGRQRGLDGRSASRQAGLDDRDTARRSTAEQFSEIVGDDFDRRRSKANVDRSGLTAAQKRLEELQANLQAKASEAQAKAAKSQEQSAGALKAEGSRVAAGDAIQSTGSGSVGTFVSGVANQIAGGGVQDKIAAATEQTAEGVRRLDTHVRELLAEVA